MHKSTDGINLAKTTPARPRVGVSVAIIKNGQVLLGQRRGSHGENTWSYPGGHLECGESWEDCARREVMEEVGLVIGNLRLGIVTNDIFEHDGLHYVTIGLIADYVSGVEQLLEPDKCLMWSWFDWDQLPRPLFLPILNQLSAGFKPC